MIDAYRAYLMSQGKAAHTRDRLLPRCHHLLGGPPLSSRRSRHPGGCLQVDWAGGAGPHGSALEGHDH